LNIKGKTLSKDILTDDEKKLLIDSIRTVEDFPKPGISFKDITTLLNNKDAFELLMNHLEDRYKKYNLDFIAGIEARGFLFGAALASRLKIGFVPIRKKGKLQKRNCRKCRHRKLLQKQKKWRQRKRYLRFLRRQLIQRFRLRYQRMSQEKLQLHRKRASLQD
jgi:uncharacterized protein YozE (UPF0346 family)